MRLSRGTERADGRVVGAPPLVSVVIPTHDRWELLPSTLATVLGQRDVDLEVLVVDDGSATSGSRLPNDPRLRLLRHGSARGVAAARNSGLASARGRYVAFVDDDDLFAPDKLALQVAALRSEGAGWACCGAVLVDHDLRVISPQPEPPAGEVADQLLVINPIPGGGSGVLAETSLVRRVGGYDPSFSMFADWDLWVRLALQSPLAAVARPLLAYRLHAGAMSWRHAGTREEIVSFERKHAHVLSDRGLAVDRAQLELWMAGRRQRSGERVGPAMGFLRSAPLIGRQRSVSRALEAFLWPGAYRYRDRRWGRRLREDWRVELDDWLPQAARAERLRLRPPQQERGRKTSPELVGSDVGGDTPGGSVPEVITRSR